MLQRSHFSLPFHHIIRFIVLLVCFTTLPVLAQDSDGDIETGVTYGGRITGQITNQSPRHVYYFEGQRGEVVSISLRATGGNLDLILTIMDITGNILLTQDDSRGMRDIQIDALSIPQSNRYYVIVGRFGYGLGSTTGGFELILQRIGVSSSSGSALRYGDSVINNISNMNPQVYYSFRAERGDLVNISMFRDSGDLDPYLQVVDSNAFVVADNDDVPGSGLDAKIERLLIENSGTYIIVATRYGEAAGTSTGRFILTLDTATGSGLGNSPQSAVPILIGDTVEDSLSADEFTKYYIFDARENDLITIRMSRVNGSLDSFLVLADSNLQEIAADDDSGGGQNAEIQSFLIPADGRYYILATRFERDDGTTTGGFRLEFQSLGNAFDTLPEGTQRIAYGTTITGRIDDVTPTLLFAFYGNEGDAITVSLNRGDGDLDPVLSILDSSQNVLTRDDDSGGGQNARVARYVLPSTGLYYIRAERFSGEGGNPNTHGSFIMVLARLVNQ